MSDSENDDDAFVEPIASWFVLIDDRLQNQTDSKHYGIHKASSIYQCNLTVYVGLRDDLGAQSGPIVYRRVYVSAEAVIRPLESRFRGQKKHTLTQQLSVLILYHVVQRGSSVVECRSRNQMSPVRIPLCYRFEDWAFSFSPLTPLFTQLYK